MYSIVNGTLDFPTGYFVQNYFPHCSSHGILNYIRSFARTNYSYSSFVPSVISLWNNLPDSVITSISVFKGSHTTLASTTAIYVDLVLFRRKFHLKKNFHINKL